MNLINNSSDCVVSRCEATQCYQVALSEAKKMDRLKNVVKDCFYNLHKPQINLKVKNRLEKLLKSTQIEIKKTQKLFKEMQKLMQSFFDICHRICKRF
ncbi:MAG: hypothetical protein K0S74_1363 [Chlamydiales bacterium]|jgi:hypothetical protein|nr:hypothetical protein [Chlamydiales bacterium]